MRRTGLGMAMTATMLWLFFVGLVLFTPRDDGVPIGAGLLVIVAVPLSVAASVIMILSLRTATLRRHQAAGPTKTPTRWIAAALAALSALLLPVLFVLGSTDSLGRDLSKGLLFLGVGAFVTATVLFAMPAKNHADLSAPRQGGDTA